MRIFLAGATGVLGIRLVPLLVEAGHEVAGTTRSPEKGERVRELGGEPVVLDVFEKERLVEAVTAFGPEVVMHQLTALPDDPARIAEAAAANARIRSEGTRNLLAAARAAGAPRFLAQSIAWNPPSEHETLVLEAGGVVLRYGRLYGPGTYYERERPDPPRIHVDDAARRTVEALDARSGIVTLTEGDVTKTT